jgi:predicted HAD superfamily phosphohydrolase YqeG
LDAVLQKVAETSARTVIFDVEPLVAFWDTDELTLDRGIATVVSRVAALGDVQVIGFATNSLRRAVVDQASGGVRVFYVLAARKPMRLAPYRGLPSPGVVVGDQVATDGVLARRLGFAFAHYYPRLNRIPVGPRLMRQLGRPLRPLLFDRKPSGS